VRRATRIAGTVLIVAGVLMVAWTVVVWRWQDPFTALYTRYQQHKLASSYQHLLASFPAPHYAAGATLAEARSEVRSEARTYRLHAKPGSAIGRIRIPRLGLNMVFVNGTDHETLKKGPGRYLGSFMPGEGQLIYVAGHRTTYLAPFSHIDSLRRGDRVTLAMPYGTFEYSVTRHVIVPADDLAVLRSHGREVLALQACHPRFFATHRYIAYAKLVRFSLPSGRTFALGAASGSPTA
jgi:sortase A